MGILIAADAETLQAERTARDIEKEAELVRAATRQAKDFRATLDVFGHGIINNTPPVPQAQPEEKPLDRVKEPPRKKRSREREDR